MQGVEILTSTQVATEMSFNPDVSLITFLVILGLFIFLGIILVITNTCEIEVITGLTFMGIILGVIIGFISGNICTNPADYEIQHKVIISEDVSMNEFTSKYEIIEQEGKIYTVREKLDN